MVRPVLRRALASSGAAPTKPSASGRRRPSSPPARSAGCWSGPSVIPLNPAATWRFTITESSTGTVLTPVDADRTRTQWAQRGARRDAPQGVEDHRQPVARASGQHAAHAERHEGAGRASPSSSTHRGETSGRYSPSPLTASRLDIESEVLLEAVVVLGVVRETHRAPPSPRRTSRRGRRSARGRPSSRRSAASAHQS